MIDDLKKLVVKEKHLVAEIKAANVKKQGKLLRDFKKLNDHLPKVLSEVQLNGKNAVKSGKLPKMAHVKPTRAKKRVPKAKTGSSYARISNKFFIKKSEKLVPLLSNLGEDLKKANMGIILISYISMMLFSILLSFVVVFIGFVFIIAFNLSLWIYFWAIFAVPVLVGVFFYIYPSSEASENNKAITYELPFATIHMAAIASSNVEPTKIFKIIAATDDYSHIGREMKKIISQVEVYGYDLVTSLKNVASHLANEKMAELLGGLAINISTGGELKTYLEKKAESYLVDYRLERKKYIDIAGTFMDIYIAILIATPLIMVLMLVLMNVSGLGFEGLSLQFLMFIAIGVVIILNIIFLFILNIKQPKV